MVGFANFIPALLMIQHAKEMKENEESSHSLGVHLDKKVEREINRKCRRYLGKVILGAVCFTAASIGGTTYLVNRPAQPNPYVQKTEIRETIKPYVGIGYNPLTNRTGVEIR